MHSKYLDDNREVPEIEKRLHEGRTRGCLDRYDLKKVIEWGGNPHDVDRGNADDRIESVTRDVINVLDNHDKVLKRIMGCNGGIKGLGTAFGSKVLAFLSPETFPVLDVLVNRCLSETCNWTGRYDDFVMLCRNIAAQQEEENEHRLDGAWLVRDIEMALFQFGWRRRGTPNKYITGRLPLDP